MTYYNNYDLKDIIYINDIGIECIEKWNNIPLCEGEYMASDLGRIKSIKREYFHPIKGLVKVDEKILRQMLTNYGYTRVQISINRIKTKFPTHRLIGSTFLPNPENKPCINHKNGVRDDNRLCNIEWNTYSENNLHSYRILGKEPSLNWLGKVGKLHFRSKRVYCPTLQMYFESARQAAIILGISQGSISHICNQSQLHTEGLVFNYA